MRTSDKILSQELQNDNTLKFYELSITVPTNYIEGDQSSAKKDHQLMALAILQESSKAIEKKELKFQ